jgi:hypothetical protein
MLNILSCGLNIPPRSDNWFFTKIYDFATPATDQDITQIFLVDENIGFLLGDDLDKMMDEGKTDRLTNQHYVKLGTPDYDDGLRWLYCIENKGLMKLPNDVYSFNVYGDYIGCLGTYNGTAMYGKGHVWAVTVGNRYYSDNIYYPLMVRILPEK